jgi:hypothetical protein
MVHNIYSHQLVRNFTRRLSRDYVTRNDFYWPKTNFFLQNLTRKTRKPPKKLFNYIIPPKCCPEFFYEIYTF